MTPIRLNLNGEAVQAEVEPRTHLADFLRERRHLTGTHLGCEQGVCGACTVLLDGAPARSCITLAVACDGAEVTSIEGLDDDEATGRLRQAFNRRHGLQCGYCTPGMLIMARDIVRRLPDADRSRVRHELSGNLCRCTGYQGIVDAICDVLEARRGAPPETTGGIGLGPAGSGHGGAARTPVSVGARRPATSTPSAVPPTAVRALPQTPQVEEAFTLPYPPDRVWDAMGDVARVARCMPGAELDTPPEGCDVAGRLQVKLGPMTAAFSGAAVYRRDADAQTGTLSGGGTDPRSGTNAKGRLHYRLVPGADGASTTVEIALTYALSGPLAQFARGALVRDLVRRLTATFADNLEAELDGRPGATAASTPLDSGALLRDVLSTAARRWLGTLAFWRRRKD